MSAPRILTVTDWREGLPGLAPEKRMGSTTDGVTRLVAATDRRAIAICHTEASLLVPPFPAESKVATTLLDIWALEPKNPRRMTLGELVNALGEAERPELTTCDYCNGTGRMPTSDKDCRCECCVCSECDAKPVVDEPAPRKRFVPDFVTRFDANLLALALSSIGGLRSDEPVTLSDAAPALTLILVCGEGWRVGCMGMMLDDDDRDLAPLFATDAAP